jgi:hypothetical protein
MVLLNQMGGTASKARTGNIGAKDAPDASTEPYYLVELR